MICGEYCIASSCVYSALCNRITSKWLYSSAHQLQDRCCVGCILVGEYLQLAAASLPYCGLWGVLVGDYTVSMLDVIIVGDNFAHGILLTPIIASGETHVPPMGCPRWRREMGGFERASLAGGRQTGSWRACPRMPCSSTTTHLPQHYIVSHRRKLPFDLHSGVQMQNLHCAGSDTVVLNQGLPA